ncbi:MAG: septum formation protein Maf [Alistipes sp.]|nr:septum formation protein Maf [Alistipes sp.]
MLLHKKLESYNLILASASPRRRELLAACGIKFTLAQPFECEESYPATLAAEDVAQYLSQLKSSAYPLPLEERDIVLTADTVVIADSKILGKPADRAEAESMLSMLSGRTHKVITGVTIRTKTRSQSFSVVSAVHFRDITAEEIDYYITTYRPFDKAGAYGIQEWIGYVAIEGIEGSFFNVMGLPVQRLYVELEQFLAADLLNCK